MRNHFILLHSCPFPLYLRLLYLPPSIPAPSLLALFPLCLFPLRPFPLCPFPLCPIISVSSPPSLYLPSLSHPFLLLLSLFLPQNFEELIYSPPPSGDGEGAHSANIFTLVPGKSSYTFEAWVTNDSSKDSLYLW